MKKFIFAFALIVCGCAGNKGEISDAQHQQQEERAKRWLQTMREMGLDVTVIAQTDGDGHVYAKQSFGADLGFDVQMYGHARFDRELSPEMRAAIEEIVKAAVKDD